MTNAAETSKLRHDKKQNDIKGIANGMLTLNGQAFRSSLEAGRSKRTEE